MGILKLFAKEGFREGLSILFWKAVGGPIGTLAGPVLSAITAFVLSYIDGIPLTYMFLSVLAAFAVSTWGLLAFSQWSFSRDPKWKLRFNEGIAAWAYNKDDPENVDVTIGFTVNSLAKFPISFHVKEIKTILGNNLNPNPVYKIRTIDVPSLGEAFYYDDIITVRKSDLQNTIEGSASYTLHYGKTGGPLKHEIKKHKRCSIYMDNSDLLHHVFVDAEATNGDR